MMGIVDCGKVAVARQRVRRLWARPLVLTAVVAGCMVVSPGNSAASEGKPFAMPVFTMKPTERTEEKILEHLNGGFTAEFFNQPYSFTAAGGRPWGLTTTGEFATEEYETLSEHTTITPAHDPRDIVVNLPPGLLADPLATPRCPISQVTDSQELCPADTQIGTFILHYGDNTALGPIVNVVPEAGQSAEFAIEFAKEPFLLTAHLVHTSAGYGFTVVSDEIPGIQLWKFELTFWGDPSDPSHDSLRDLQCFASDSFHGNPFSCPEHPPIPFGAQPLPFLLMPSDCAEGEQTATARADSWEQPGRVHEGEYEGFTETAFAFPAATGCAQLPFEAAVEARPDTLQADAPTGLEVDVQVHQTETPQSPAAPQLRDAVVTLPEGVSISPGVVDGIRACPEAGPEGINFEGPESEEVGTNGELQLAAGHCPSASTVGTAEAITPLLPEPVKGHVYLAKPLCGGAGQHRCTTRDAVDGDLYQLYLELGGVGPLANTGIHIKAHGFVEANPATGQLTTKFLEDPQAPFSELKIHLNGGQRASLDTPATCGPAVTTADFTPWSAPGVTPEGQFVAGTPDAVVSSRPFEVQGCTDQTPFDPGFTAGTVTPQAGQYSSFTLDFSRHDREQFVKGIRVHTPPGLLGMLSNVPLCEEPQADEGTCPESSKIGTTRVASGAGSHPFEIEGDVYLTESYGGAPFGISVVTDAVAGPFNLGKVIVRGRIEVDPTTSALTVTTDETGPYALPQILDGVPLRLKRVTVKIDRPDFMFNPTSCAAQQVSAEVSGTGQTVAHVSSPFAVGGCKSLVFTPRFTAQTNGRTSRKRGASLDVRLRFPRNAMRNDANVAKVRVELPKALPSYLATLQKACLAQTFNENPAACPSGAVVGIAKAKTPVLPVQLEGPAYFVSNGSAKFPSLVVVLQGDGVRVDLEGETFISKEGITSSTFETVPDVPVESFELYLPQGSNHALAANVDLCRHRRKLVMPTTFWAQNGSVLKQRTKIAVTGCGGNGQRSRHKQATRAHAGRTRTGSHRTGRR